MWLGEVFTELGYQAIPALHCRQALGMAKRFESPIAILIINPELRGARRLVETLSAGNPKIRIVLISNPAGLNASNPSGIRASSTLERPAERAPISREDWVAKIRRLLSMASAQ